MSAAATAPAVLPPEGVGEIPQVLEGTALHGAAARLAGALDQKSLDELGWDPRRRLLALPVDHQLAGRGECRAPGCAGTAVPGLPGVCTRCFTRLTGLGLSASQIASDVELPAAPRPTERCAVPECLCAPTVRQSILCEPHARQFRNRRHPLSMEQFLANRRVRPLPPARPCLVAACTRSADGAAGYCNTHYQRWRLIRRADSRIDAQWWQATEPGVAEPGQVNLRALSSLAVIEVLFGICQRIRVGAKLNAVTLKAISDQLRRRQATSIDQLEADQLPTKAARSLHRAFVRDVRRALTDPGAEAHKDTWDLAVFGHRGNLVFSGISQGWLAEAAKRWAAEELPRHRGGGGARVQSMVSSLGMLSECLGLRADHGLVPSALGRPDIESFCNRLAHLESSARISRYRRNLLSRDVRAVLAGIRFLGLTRAGQPAAGLSGDFAIERSDIPATPERGEPGRDLPPEILVGLCANLDSLGPAEVTTAVKIGIDTGRRPEEILALPVDCLARDKDGRPVLVYTNAKSDRLGRRLPISEATASVIEGQQRRVQERFPKAPAGELKLLPAPRRNPWGTRPISISMLERRHREWVNALPELQSSDGVRFDKARIVPYAYRHSFAQRHADAGVPIDVLAELLDHRSYTITRSYYRIGEDRRRAAIDKVAALSFDRRGKRIWREALVLLESEHARYALGEVSVPYGVCAEPSNVKAGGGACPFRFRCVGCDHFRTDVSYLPDLQAYLDDLRRNRERVLAATDVEGWAQAEALPSEEEITRVRRLIARVRSGLEGLSQEERALVEDAVATVRRHRATTLGMPRVRQPQPDLGPPPPS